MVEYEVDGRSDRLDPSRLLVRHHHAVRVLELLHQRVEVERGGLQVALEVRGLVDPRRVELQLVGEVGPDGLEDLVAGHGWSGTLDTTADTSAGACRSAPAPASVSSVRPTTSSRTPRAASRIALVIPAASNEPCGTTTSLRRPSRTAPPTACGSSWSRSSRKAGRSIRPPIVERLDEVAASRTAPSSTAEVPSITFSTTLPVKPSVTITSASPVPIAKPSTLPTKFRRDSASESTAWAATRSSGPFDASSPLLSSATRGRETPIAVSMNAAPMCANCTRCSGRTSTLAPASSSRNGEPGTGTSTASAGRW